MSAQSDQRAGLAVISGKVKDVKGAGVKGATVTVEGQKVEGNHGCKRVVQTHRRESRLGVPLCENAFTGVSGR